MTAKVSFQPSGERTALHSVKTRAFETVEGRRGWVTLELTFGQEFGDRIELFLDSVDDLKLLETALRNRESSEASKSARPGIPPTRTAEFVNG